VRSFVVGKVFSRTRHMINVRRVSAWLSVMTVVMVVWMVTPDVPSPFGLSAGSGCELAQPVTAAEAGHFPCPDSNDIPGRNNYQCASAFESAGLQLQDDATDSTPCGTLPRGAPGCVGNLPACPLQVPLPCGDSHSTNLLLLSDIPPPAL